MCQITENLGWLANQLKLEVSGDCQRSPFCAGCEECVVFTPADIETIENLTRQVQGHRQIERFFKRLAASDHFQ